MAQAAGLWLDSFPADMPRRRTGNRGLRTLAVLGLAAAALAAGCRSSPAPPDLGALYNRSAEHHGPERNPVIVIPGILGSKLIAAVVEGRQAGEVVENE